MKILKILLVSPLDPDQPQELKYLMGGENTYTRMLLAHPPQGIKFVHFEEALRQGSISYNPLQNLLLWLQKLRILPLGPRVIAIRIHERYDLIYAHGHPVRVFGPKIPLVISDSSSNLVFLERYLKWPKWRNRLGQYIKLIIYNACGVIDGEVNSDVATRKFVFSRWARKIKQQMGLGEFEVIYPGLNIPPVKEGSRFSNWRTTKNIKILFVGVWFERKGGRILLKVFRRLVKRYQNIDLTILGQLPFDVSIYQSEHIKHKEFVSYKELLQNYKSHDILVHVPPEIEGYGMTVPEAMSYGMVPVVSDICALPEFVEDGISGLVVKAGSEIELEKALTELIINKKFRQGLSLEARKRFVEKFSLPVMHKKLSALFLEVSRTSI